MSDTQISIKGSDMARIPMPGDWLNGGTVIASVYTGPDDESAVLLILQRSTPYYTVGEVSLDATSHLLWSEQYENIVPAVDSYQQNGGDY